MIGTFLKSHHQRRNNTTDGVAAKDADPEKRDMTLRHFDHVGRIESNHMFDLKLDASRKVGSPSDFIRFGVRLVETKWRS